MFFDFLSLLADAVTSLRDIKKVAWPLKIILLLGGGLSAALVCIFAFVLVGGLLKC